MQLKVGIFKGYEYAPFSPHLKTQRAELSPLGQSGRRGGFPHQISCVIFLPGPKGFPSASVGGSQANGGEGGCGASVPSLRGKEELEAKALSPAEPREELRFIARSPGALRLQVSQSASGGLGDPPCAGLGNLFHKCRGDTLHFLEIL